MTKPWEETWEYLSGSYPADVYIKGRSASQGGKVADVWHEEMHEAAGLIAAAPELYQALAAMVGVYNSINGSGPEMSSREEKLALRDARGALKKARGER